MASSAPAPAPAPAQPAPTQAAAPAPAPAPAPATVINTAKVFVGNLSFKTREPDLAHEFEAVGKVYVTLTSRLQHFPFCVHAY